MAQARGEGFNRGVGGGIRGTGVQRRPRPAVQNSPYTNPTNPIKFGVTAQPRQRSFAPAINRRVGGGGGGYSGGGGGGGGFSRGVGSNSSGRISSKAPPPAPKPPPPPNPAQWLLTDTAYKAQMDAQQKAMKDYMAQKTAQENTYNTEYTTNLGDLGKQEKLDYGDLEADYGARGMGFGSGAAQKALADLTGQYNDREARLLADRNEYLANLTNALTNFQGTSNINQQRYKQEALARRAARYGL